MRALFSSVPLIHHDSPLRLRTIGKTTCSSLYIVYRPCSDIISHTVVNYWTTSFPMSVFQTWSEVISVKRLERVCRSKRFCDQPSCGHFESIPSSYTLPLTHFTTCKLGSSNISITFIESTLNTITVFRILLRAWSSDHPSIHAWGLFNYLDLLQEASPIFHRKLLIAFRTVRQSLGSIHILVYTTTCITLLLCTIIGIWNNNNDISRSTSWVLAVSLSLIFDHFAVVGHSLR